MWMTLAASLAMPSVSIKFSCSKVTTCFGSFPGCAHDNQTIGYAIDDEARAELQGPLSTLPTDLNQQLLVRFDLGLEFLLWVDVSSPAKKVILLTPTL